MAVYTPFEAATAPAVDIFRIPAALTEPSVSTALSEPFVALKGFSMMGTGSMLALAGLDLIGAYCAMRYLHTGHQAWWSVGAISYVFLFGVYAASLKWAELGTVTLGWIVFLQVGVLIMDKVANGTVLPTGKWVAVAAILGLMGYVLLAPNPKTYSPRHIDLPTGAVGVAPSGAAGAVFSDGVVR
jgi:hypothetical protein